MKVPRAAPALLVLAALLGGGLTGCRPDAGAEGGRGMASDLTAQLLFTANGSYDARADERARIGGGLRRVTWTTRLPLPARAVTVRYDGDARPLLWEMTVQDPSFSARSLAGEGAAAVTTPQGEGLRPREGRLKGVLILRTPGGLRLLTRGFAIQEEPALLPAFTGR